MKKFVLVLAAVLTLSLAAFAGEPVDRIIASVNDDPVLATDVDDAIRMEAFMQGRPLAEIPLGDRKAALERIVDRKLIRQQMSSMYIPAEDEVNTRLAQIRSAFPQAKTESGWRETLTAYGIDEQKLRNNLEDQVQLMHFVDARLRPTVHITNSEVEGYYNETLVPELKRKNAAVEPLTKVQWRIRELLVQQKIDSQLNVWLSNLRNQGNVRMMDSVTTTAAGAGPGSMSMSFAVVRR